MALTPEDRTELLEILRQELVAEERKKERNKALYKRVCDGFEDQFAWFDYVKQSAIKRLDGSTYTFEQSHQLAYRIRAAFGTLLRAIYQSDTVSQLQAEHEEQMKQFIQAVLNLMKEQKAPLPGVEDPNSGMENKSKASMAQKGRLVNG